MAQIRNQYYTPGQSVRWEKTPDGFLRCRARVLREGVMPYARSEIQGIPDSVTSDPVMMLVTGETLTTGDTLRSLEGAVVVSGGHVWISPENAGSSVHGHAAGAPRVDGPFLEVDLLVTDPSGIARIESGELCEVSAGYHGDTIFESGDFDGQRYDARQVALRFNHIAIIPRGTGRAGEDVRILNSKKGDPPMSDIKTIRIRLPRTGRFINTDDEGAREMENEMAEEQKANQKMTQSYEDAVGQLEEKTQSLAALQTEVETLKGELMTYKKKLDELLSEEAVEHKVMERLGDLEGADEIVENCQMKNEDGSDMAEDKKQEFKNSLRKLHGAKLHEAVLRAVGIRIENMSPEAIRGAFSAQRQILKAFGGVTVSGNRMTQQVFQNSGGSGGKQYNAHEILGFQKK